MIVSDAQAALRSRRAGDRSARALLPRQQASAVAWAPARLQHEAVQPVATSGTGRKCGGGGCGPCGALAPLYSETMICCRNAAVNHVHVTSLFQP